MKKTFLIIFGIIFVFLIIPYTNSAMSENNVEELLEKGYYNFENKISYKESMKYFDQVLLVEPNNTNALNGKAAVYLKMGNFTGAEIYLDKTLGIDPNHVSALNNKGSLLGYNDEYDKAISYFDKILVLQQNNTDALMNKANALAFKEEFSEVIEELNKLLSIDPDHKDATKLKQDIYFNFPMTHAEGYSQTIVRDKDGNLIGYMESDKISIADYTHIYDILVSIIKQHNYKIVTDENGEEFILGLIHLSVSAKDPLAKFKNADQRMQTGSGISWIDKTQSEELNFPVILSRFHGNLIDEDDVMENYWQLVLKE